MSQYRLAVQNGMLVRQKRKLLRFWLWCFNRSEEDHLIKMKNELMMAREKVKILSRRIPKEEERLKKIRDTMVASGEANGRSYRDAWTARKEPVRLLEPVNLARKKRDRKVKDPPRPLFNITPSN